MVKARPFDPNSVMARDAQAIARAVNNGKVSDRLKMRWSRSIEQLARRESSVPLVSYPSELPISEHCESIAELIRAHPVVIVAGETGSGKTTQLPKACLAAGLGRRGMIGHTQPRRLAARMVAQRVASELSVPLGDEVGYAVRFDDKWNENSLVKVMTDGLLLNEIRSDRHLNAYDAIIVDEAHERSLNVDFLLGYVRRLLERRDDLKVVITSATIDVDTFSQHFFDAPVVTVSGRGYPVETRYRPVSESLEETLRTCLTEIREEKTKGPRDVLVFLPGERDILDWSRWINRQFRDQYEVLPLYARLPPREQKRIFEPGKQHRIVLATNVAETSLTVPNIGYVVDLGDARISRYSFRSKLQRLPIEPISKASADQRQGRCGRVAPGICYRLYEEADYESRPLYTDPEIRRTNLAAVVLQMRAFRLGDVATFPFMDPPDPRVVNDAVRLLHELQALDDDKLTEKGNMMARLPVDPRLARMVIEAHQFGSLADVLIIVAALAVQDPRLRPLDKQAAADKAHERFADEASDFLGFVNLWTWANGVREDSTRSGYRRALEQNFLSVNRMGEWRSVHRQLLLVCRDLGLRLNKKAADYASLHRALLAGSLSFIGLKTEKGNYVGPRNLMFRVFPGSVLASKRPKWLVAAEISETQQTYARCNAQVEARWIEHAAPHLIRRTYGEPGWDEKRGEVMASERAVVYGVPVVENRRISYGRIDPTICRQLFIRHALVAPSVHIDAPFLDHNRELVIEIMELQAKGRRTDMLASEDAQCSFYDERLPIETISIRSFEGWYRSIGSDQRDRLMMTQDDLLKRADFFPEDDEFPGRIEIDGVEVDVRYRFAPGTDDDGISIEVPLGLLAKIRQETLDWLVPGFFEEKCIELIKSLPKQTRKQLAPVPDRVAAIFPSLISVDRYRRAGLLRALAQIIRDRFDVDIPLSEWNIDRLAPFLRMNVQVLDNKRRLIDQDRDVEALKSRLLASLEERMDAGLRAKLEMTGLTVFPDSGLPESMILDESGEQLLVYPLLVDGKHSVDFRLDSDQKRQLRCNRQGLSRLALLAERQSVRYVRKELDKENVLFLHYATLGTRDELVDEVLQNTAWIAYFQDFDIPRSRGSFEERLRERRGQLVETYFELIEWVRTVLDRRFDTARELGDLSSKPFARARNDMEEQLSWLVPHNFLSTTPYDRLPDLVRYLEGMRYRIDHLQGRVGKDKSNIDIIDGWRERYIRLKEVVGNEDVLVRLRFLLEEYRITLFSQAVGAREKVSEKRLEREFRSLEMEAGLL
ncbi:MAG: ATP-dependent RNA helicase HrpA [Pseudomonadota bacterium]|nr:ATP-dependent RNA helicase HrpA [Pseudomonadota bacterium]